MKAMDGLSRGEWMEKQAQTIWDGMTSVQRLPAVALERGTGQGVACDTRQEAQERSEAAAPADPPWKSRKFLERLLLVVGDDETLAKHIIEEPDHLGAEREALFKLGQDAWKKEEGGGEANSSTSGEKGRGA